ncbi:MAG: class I SAM-dependent methyltransferase [Candidatus Micrarchaeia archaeon]|jgi:SAM-dependent methyltransferase
MVHFADFWDEISDKKAARQRAAVVLRLIGKYHPGAKTILELGVGNGTVLAAFPKRFSLYGLDIEPRYLKLAKKKLPRAHLFCASMHNFTARRKFDVIYSVYDSMNFLSSFRQWAQTFARVRSHLAEGGIYIFDCYTSEMLPALSKIKGASVSGNSLTWTIRMVRKGKKHRFKFRERLFPEKKVECALAKHLIILEKRPLSKTRLLFVTRKGWCEACSGLKCRQAHESIINLNQH